MNLFQSLLGGPRLAEIGAPLPPLHERIHLPEGDAGTAKTIEIMQKLTASGKRNDDVRKVVGDVLTGKIPGFSKQNPKDYLNYAKALYRFCRDKILYAYDPHLVEYVESPDRVLKNGIADCDSVCTLLSAMLQNIGLETQFVTIKADPRRKDEYSHVYLRVNIPGHGWIACDPIMHQHDFGWEAPSHYGIRYWHGSSDETGMPLDTKASRSMSGLGEEVGIFDWLFGTDAGGEETPRDVLPGPVNPQYQAQYNALTYQQQCPAGYVRQAYAVGNAFPPQFGFKCAPNSVVPGLPSANPITYPQYPYNPAAYTPVSNCQIFTEQRKQYQAAMQLATRNYNACKRGRATTAMFGLGEMSGKPIKRSPRFFAPTTKRPVKKKFLKGLGCGCTAPVIAGMGAMRPVIGVQTVVPGDTYIDQPDFKLQEMGDIPCAELLRLFQTAQVALKNERRKYAKLRTKKSREADTVASKVVSLQNTVLELKRRINACRRSPNGMAGLGCGDTPCAPCAAKKAAGISGLGCAPIINGMGADPVVDQSILGFFGGQTKSDLLALNAQIKDQSEDLGLIWNSIQKMTDPDKKKEALAAYDKASRALGVSYSKFNAIRSQYNDAMTKVMAYATALPGIDKSMLPGLAGEPLYGMGAVQIPVAIIGTIVGALALGYVISQINSGMAILKGDLSASKGYIGQAADLVQSSGGFVQKAADAFKTITGAATDASWSALQIGAIVGLGVLMYQNRATIKDVVTGKL